MGDTHWYTIKDTDNLMTLKQWRSKCTEDFNIGPGLIHSKINKDKLRNKLFGIKKSSQNTHPIDLDPLNSDDLSSMYIIYTVYLMYVIAMFIFIFIFIFKNLITLCCFSTTCVYLYMIKIIIFLLNQPSYVI